MEKQTILTKIPKIDKILQQQEIQNLLKIYPRELLLDVIRQNLQELREYILKHHAVDTYPGDLLNEKRIIDKICLSAKLQLRNNVQNCINATGIILHTGLGRAPLSKVAQQALIEAADGFTTVEFELDSGKRGDRHKIVEELLIKLTGAEAAAVVNNNAAAVFLTLNTLSFGKDSLVSRGELITIGGSFRIPDIMSKSGAVMVEVGTTNKTNRNDYLNAITDNTALLLKVHTSNYKILGFHEEVSLANLVELGKEYQLPVLHDLGSGSLVDLGRYGLPKEPVVKECVQSGADIVTFSGDKLLGGPQAGIIVGKKKYIDQIKSNQLLRTMRCGKLTYAALEATLRLFFDEDKLLTGHRVMQLLNQKSKSIENRARLLMSNLDKIVTDKGEAEIEAGLSEVGGGSLATEALPTKLVTLKLDDMHEEDLARELRLNLPPIITRIQNDCVVFDMFTVFAHEIKEIVAAVSRIVNS